MNGGYCFEYDFDITGLINSTGDNLIAVAVNYLQKDEFRMHPVTEGSIMYPVAFTGMSDLF